MMSNIKRYIFGYTMILTIHLWIWDSPNINIGTAIPAPNQLIVRAQHIHIRYLIRPKKNVPFRGQILSVKKCLTFILIPTYCV